MQLIWAIKLLIKIALRIGEDLQAGLFETTGMQPGLMLSFNELCEQPYLPRADTDWLFADNPGDTLQQRGRGQRAIVRPVVKATREQCSGVEVGDDIYAIHCIYLVVRYNWGTL